MRKYISFPRVEGLASRQAQRLCELMASLDWEGYAAAIAESIVMDDRRSGLGGGRHLEGKERYVASILAFEDAGFVFHGYDFEVVAERPQRRRSGARRSSLRPLTARHGPPAEQRERQQAQAARLGYGRSGLGDHDVVHRHRVG